MRRISRLSLALLGLALGPGVIPSADEGDGPEVSADLLAFFEFLG